MSKNSNFPGPSIASFMRTGGVAALMASSNATGFLRGDNNFKTQNVPREPDSPSFAPTLYPINLPTIQPTPSLQPFVHLTSHPTTQPSLQQTTQPTTQPSNESSGEPSSAATEVQSSSQPTNQPTGQPSVQQSSGQPSKKPTFQPSTQSSNSTSINPSIKKFNNQESNLELVLPSVAAGSLTSSFLTGGIVTVGLESLTASTIGAAASIAAAGVAIPVVVGSVAGGIAYAAYNNADNKDIRRLVEGDASTSGDKATEIGGAVALGLAGIYWGGKALRHAGTPESNIAPFIALLLAEEPLNSDTPFLGDSLHSIDSSDSANSPNTKIDNALKAISNPKFSHSTDAEVLKNTLCRALTALLQDPDNIENISKIKEFSQALTPGNGEVATLEGLRFKLNAINFAPSDEGLIYKESIGNRIFAAINPVDLKALSEEINTILTCHQKEAPLGAFLGTAINIQNSWLEHFSPEYKLLEEATVVVLGEDDLQDYKQSILDGYRKRFGGERRLPNKVIDSNNNLVSGDVTVDTDDDGNLRDNTPNSNCEPISAISAKINDPRQASEL